ncbi:MAG: InlB B-repeat-containing protein, partial [Clostridiales bacterium]|nr:InlB B-repeat-containing protein [Clostridiales bacterium]
MKKGKLLLSVLAAAVFATAAGTLVACSDVELPQGNGDKKPVIPTPPDTGKVYTVTFNANGGTLVGSSTLSTDKDGYVKDTTPTATKADNTFNGWTLTQGDTTVINFNTQKFTSDKTVYAVFTPNGTPGPGPTEDDEYTITFLDGEHGTVSGQNQLTTVNGKIETFPTVIPETGWDFDYWIDGDGNTVTESTVFTQSTTVIAKYTEATVPPNPDIDEGTYYLIGSITEWGVNSDEMYAFEKIKDSDDGKDQYLLSIELNQDDVIKIVKGNKSQWISSWEGGWDFADIDTAETADNGNLTITQDGTYDIYLKVNKEDSDDTSVWVSKQGGGDEEDNDDPDVNANTYYLIGTITDWAVKTDAKYVFTKTKDSDDGKDQYLLSVDLKANDKVKIVLGKKAQWIGSWEGGWDYAESDDDGNLVIGSNASYDIYLKVNKTDANDTSVYVAKQGGSGEANNDDGGSNFYLFGTINGQDKWGVDKGGIKFEETELNINEDSPSVINKKYKVEVDLVARDKVKIFRTGVENSWDYSYFEAGSLGTNVVVSNTDLTVMTTGHYTFYLREYKDTTVGSNGYTVRVFFVAPAPAENATAKINDINIPSVPVDNNAAGHATLVKWYKATGVQIAANTKIKFYVDGKVISVLMRAAMGTSIEGAENMAEEFTVLKGDTFEIHIKYYSDDGWKVWMKGNNTTPVTPPTPTPNVDANAYYLVGTMTGWSVNPATTYKFTPKENENDSRTQYMLTIKLNKDDVVKIVKGDGAEWIGDWQQNWAYGVKDDDSNLVIQQNGTYEFYLKLAKDDMPTEIWVSQQSASGGNGGGGGGNTDSTFGECSGDGAWLVGAIQA